MPFFRDALREGPHRHLVDDQLFGRVQALLSEGGGDYPKRASATSPFLLAGLVVCARCGKHFVGTSAVGNCYRYRYYTCFTRQCYGTKYCDAERLPAEDLDVAVLDALLHTYERTDLFDKAVAAARRRARAERGNHEQELAVVDAGVTKAEGAIERHLTAFETGTLSEAQCGKRLEGLAAKVRDLRVRREELVAAMRRYIAHALTGGAVPARKALLQALVHEIRVENRDRVVPWFRVPGGVDQKVRALARSVPPAGFEPARPAPEAGALSPELRGRRHVSISGRCSPRPGAGLRLFGPYLQADIVDHQVSHRPRYAPDDFRTLFGGVPFELWAKDDSGKELLVLSPAVKNDGVTHQPDLEGFKACQSKMVGGFLRFGEVPGASAVRVAPGDGMESTLHAVYVSVAPAVSQ